MRNAALVHGSPNAGEHGSRLQDTARVILPSRDPVPTSILVGTLPSVTFSR